MSVIVTKVETYETNIPVSQNQFNGQYAFTKYERTRITCLDDAGGPNETEHVYDVPSTSAVAALAAVDTELSITEV